MRELVWMARGKAAHDWQQTSEILAVLYNANRDPKKKPKPWEPGEFNPYYVKPRPRLATEADLMLARKFFGAKP